MLTLRSLLMLPVCAAVAAAQTASYSHFGTGCNGTPVAPCFALNDTAPVLRVASLPNEYGYPVFNTATTAKLVLGFEVFTVTNSLPFATGNGRIMRDDAGAGALTHTRPSANHEAAGMIEVANVQGWYSVAVSPPVLVQPGEAFWVNLDAYSAIAPPQNNGGSPAPAGIWYRRPNLNSYAWTSSVSVTNPILRVLAADPSPGVPTLSNTGTPALGQTFSIDIAGNLPFGPAFLVFAFSNTSWLGLPTPVSLAPFGGPGCFNYTSSDSSSFLLLDGSARASLSLAVPATPTLSGFVFYNQAALGGASNPLGLFVSNAGRGRIGN